MDKLHFINPEYLWGLLFLLIPIIVHLFNFRKAKIVYFTRVDLLKEVKTKKRKFSSLKKRLILLSRLLAILFLVFATSSPYLSNTDLNHKSTKATFMFLDNSFSMQAKSGGYTLLELAKKKLKNSYRDFNGVSQVFLLSNDGFARIDSENELMLEMSNIDFSYHKFSTLKVKSQVSRIAEENNISDFNILIFSDFNERKLQDDSLFSEINIAKIRVSPSEINNVSIDSVWLKTVAISENKFTLNYKISNQSSKDVGFNENIKFNNKVQQTLSRSVNSYSDTILEIKINIPQSKKASGVISVQDGGMEYDNDLFFSVDFSEKSEVLFVGDKSNERLDFILNDDFVELENTSHSSFRNQDLSNFDFVIYSVPQSYSESDVKLLKDYLSTAKELLLVPSKNLSSRVFNAFVRALHLGRVANFKPKELAVTEINYENIFFDDIFNSPVYNFDFPIVKGSYSVSIPEYTKLLSLENGNPLLLKIKNAYLFTSAIFEKDNMFLNSDLALPVIYKMATSSIRRNMYKTVGELSEINIDRVNLQLDLDDKKIELNKLSANKFELPTITKSGNFYLYSNGEIVKTISYNYSRSESVVKKNKGRLKIENQKYEELKNQSNVIYLWKWCITFTLAFLIIEMLLISFLKEKNIEISE